MKLFGKRKKKKKFLKKRGDHVSVDWTTALGVLILATGVVIAISIFIFIGINAEDEAIVDLIDSESIIDEELLADTLQYYEEKRSLFLKYQNEVPAPLVPPAS